MSIMSVSRIERHRGVIVSIFGFQHLNLVSFMLFLKLLISPTIELIRFFFYTKFIDRFFFQLFLCLGQWWMIFQIFLTIFACVMLVVEFYIGTQGWLLVLEVDLIWFHRCFFFFGLWRSFFHNTYMQIIYTAFFIIDYIIFFCAASDKLKYFLF